MSTTEAASAPLVSLHTHTNLSHCAKPEMTLDAAVALAVEHDYRALGFSDHVHIAEVTDRPAHAQRLRRYRSHRDKAGWPIQVLIGGELIQAKGVMVECDEILEVCEYTVVAPNHYHLDWVECVGRTCAEVAAHEVDCFETALEWPHTDIIAHPYVGKLREPEHEPNAMWKATDKGGLARSSKWPKSEAWPWKFNPRSGIIPSVPVNVAELIDLWLDGGALVSHRAAMPMP